MILWKIPRIVKKFYPGLIWNFTTDHRAVYLTFDDGPTIDVTLEVIEILKQYNIQATFFCIGRNVERNPDIFQVLIETGCAVGNHTYSHIKGWKTSDPDYFSDIELASRYIQSNLFRPAYGQIKPSQTRHLRLYYRIIMWSLMSYDFHPEMTKEKCLNHVIKNTKPGSILVFHDSIKASENMLYTLPRALEYFIAQGFEFKTIPSAL